MFRMEMPDDSGDMKIGIEIGFQFRTRKIRKSQPLGSQIIQKILKIATIL
jgi:hypothetical protein